MADKPTLYIDYQGGKIRGPGEIMGRLFATPKAKGWYPPPESIIVISDPQRFQQTVARLHELGYPLVETPPAGDRNDASTPSPGGFAS